MAARITGGPTSTCLDLTSDNDCADWFDYFSWCFGWLVLVDITVDTSILVVGTVTVAVSCGAMSHRIFMATTVHVVFMDRTSAFSPGMAAIGAWSCVTSSDALSLKSELPADDLRVCGAPVVVAHSAP